MLTVDLEALEVQARRLSKVAELIDDMGMNLRRQCSRLSDIPERDGVTAPLSEVLEQNRNAVRGLSEKVEAYAIKLIAIVNIYSDTDDELAKMAHALNLQWNRENAPLASAGSFVPDKTGIFPSEVGSAVFSSKNNIDDDWLFTHIAEHRYSENK